MKKEMIVFCDMDGVLADFNAETNAVERFKSEKHFFRNLKPIQENLNAILRYIAYGYDVRILTTSPHKRADRDKAQWLKKHLPAIKRDKIIYGRPEKAKIEYVKRKERSAAVLFDDYGKNIREWSFGGGALAIKITPEPQNKNTDFISIKEYQKIYGISK